MLKPKTNTNKSKRMDRIYRLFQQYCEEIKKQNNNKVKLNKPNKFIATKIKVFKY